MTILTRAALLFAVTFLCLACDRGSDLGVIDYPGADGDGESENEISPDGDSEIDGDQESEGETQPDSLDLNGTFMDAFGGAHRITDTRWTTVGYGDPSVFHISYYDNAAGVVIAQNDATYNYNPSAWSRFDRTIVDETIHYCQTAYAAESEQAARDLAPADQDDLVSGCAGFSWSTIEPSLSLIGGFSDGFAIHSITDSIWTMSGEGFSALFNISQYDDESGVLIAQNDAANEYNPGLWSRFDWIETEDGLYYCQSAYAAESEQAALDTPAPDATDPANSGCGGFGWSYLEPLGN